MLKKSLRTRRFVARYISYIEVFGYLFVAALAGLIFVAWFYKVDDTVKHDKDPVIAPKESVIKQAKGDVYVTRLFVTEKYQRVKKGEPIVEVISDPDWVDRYRAVSHVKNALDEWDKLEKKLGPKADKAAKADAAVPGVSEGKATTQDGTGPPKKAGKAKAKGVKAKKAKANPKSEERAEPAEVASKPAGDDIAAPKKPAKRKSKRGAEPKLAAKPSVEGGAETKPASEGKPGGEAEPKKAGKKANKEAEGSAKAQTPDSEQPVEGEAADAGSPTTEEQEPPYMGPLALEDARLRAAVHKAVNVWDEKAGGDAPKRILRAPHDGVVVFDKTLPGQVVAKGTELAKVADFSKLQVVLKLKGANIPDVRVGEEALISVRPVQPPNRVLRGDREGFLWRAERVQFSNLMGNPLKNWLRDELKKQPVTTDEEQDIPLDVKDVSRIEVNAKLKTTPLPQQALAAGGKDVLQPDLLHLMDLRGHVEKAKHTGKITLSEFPPAIEGRLRARLLEKVRGKAVEDARPFRVDDFRSLAVEVQVTVESDHPPKSEHEREQQLKKALKGVKDERFVDATIVLDDPPPGLTREIEAQYEKDKPTAPRVDVNVVTDRRPFAALLFRKSGGDKGGGD